jgi:hypothetical protein
VIGIAACMRVRPIISRLPDVAAKLSKFGAEIGLVNAADTAEIRCQADMT